MDELNVGDVVDSPALSDMPPAVADTDQSWDSLVDEAKTTPDPVAEPKGEEPELEPEADPPAKTDDPEPETDNSEPAADEPAKTDDTNQEDLSKRDKRTLNHKELQRLNGEITAERDTLKTEIATLTEQREKLDTELERFGGIEGMTEAVKSLELIANPAKASEAVSYLQSLPHGGQMESIFACRALGIGGVDVPENMLPTVLENQATVFSTALQRYQGLKNPLTLDQVDKLGQYIALRANDDVTDLMSEIDSALNDASTPDNEVQRLRREVEALKAAKDQPANANGADKPDAAKPQEFDYQALAQRFDDYEKDIFPKVAEKLLQDHHLAIVPTDPPEIQKAKETLSTLLFAHQSLEGRASNAFQIVANYIERNAEKSEAFRYVENDYRRTIKLNVQTAISNLLPLFKAAGAKTPTPPTPPKGSSLEVPAGDGNGKAETFDDLVNTSRPRR